MTDLRVPPSNLDAEKTVLGMLMMDASCFDKIEAMIQPLHFYRTAHKVIFTAICCLAKEGAPFDLIALANYLDRTKQLKECGGRTYLASFEGYVLSTQNPEYYCELILESYKRRETIAMCTQTSTAAHDTALNIDDALVELEKTTKRIAAASSGGSFQTMGEVAYSEMDEIEKRASGQGVYSGLPTGFLDLDRLTQGLWPGELIIVAGRTSIGKTAFALNILSNLSISRNLPCAMFSLEMSISQLHNRLLAMQSKTALTKIRRGIVKEEMDVLISTNDTIACAPLYIDSRSYSFLQMRAAIRKLKAEQPKLSLVVIDYLQLMSRGRERNSSETRESEIADITSQIKRLASEFHIPIILLSQLNRQLHYQTGASKRPQLHHLRESGAIEQDADTVLFLHRNESDNMSDEFKELVCAEVIIAKQRNGPTTLFRIGFIPIYQKFVNIAQEQNDY